MLLSTFDSFFDFLTVVFIFVVILVMTYFCTKFMAGYQKGKGLGRNIEVVETYKITTNKYIQIIKMGEKYIAVGIGKDEIHMLTELDSEQLVFPKEQPVAVTPFKDFFDKAKRMREKK